MVNLVEGIQKVGAEYLTARTQPFGGHELARFIRHEWPEAVTQLLGERMLAGVKVDGSPGKGQWAESPWLALLHKDVTDSARSGFYPVFLFETGMQTCCLVLGQGAEALEQAYGQAAALVIVKQRADAIRRAAGDWKAAGFDDGPFDTKRRLQSASSAAVDPWSSSVAFGKRYHLASPPSVAAIKADLVNMLALYRKAVVRVGARVQAEDASVEELSDSGELPSTGLDGATKVVEHKKYEVRLRNHKLAKAAKRHHGYRCQGCGLLPDLAYPGIGNSVIEAHHLCPISEAPKGGVSLTVAAFASLCPTCHRVMHRLGCPPLDDLRAVVAPWLKDAHNEADI